MSTRNRAATSLAACIDESAVDGSISNSNNELSSDDYHENEENKIKNDKMNMFLFTE